MDSETAIAVKAFFDDRPRMFETLVKVKSKEGPVVPFRLRPAQADLYGKLTGRDIVLKSRQLGFSTLFEADFLLDAVTLPNLRVATIVQNETKIPEFMDIYRFMYESLPPVIDIQGVPIKIKPESQTDNVMRLEFDNGSSIHVATSGGIKILRGSTFHRALLTEVAVWDEESAGEVWASLVGSMPPKGTKIAVETTALGRRGEFWNQWNRAMAGDSLFAPHFYPWWAEPKYSYKFEDVEVPRNVALAAPTLEEQELMVHHNLSIEQILYRRVQELAMGKARRMQEYPETASEAFLATGTSIFTMEHRELAKRFVNPPITDQNNLKVWKEPEPEAKYVVVIDSSEGISDTSDFDAMCVLCVRPPYVEHVATWMGRLTQHQLAVKAAEIGTYYNKATLCPETTGGGGQTVLYVLTDVIKYPKLYARASDGEYGFKTTKWTKPGMIDAFKELLDRDLFRTYDARVAEQMDTYEEHPTAVGAFRQGAPRGAYDDLLMAVMIGARILPEISRSRTKTIHYGRRKW